MEISIPECSLVILIGPSGAGKSTFAKQHFLPTQILSSDVCRGLVADDENDQSVSKEAFEVLHYIARKRLEKGRLTVIDATNVQKEARQTFIELARIYHFMPVAIVLDVPEEVCQQRNQDRGDRNFGAYVVRRQVQQLHRSLRGLKREGFRYIHRLRSVADIESVTVSQRKAWTNRKEEKGPFDIIGDIHGCYDEFVLLLEKLGYVIEEQMNEDNEQSYMVSHEDGRRAIFVGDLVDRGPKTPEVLKLVMAMVEQGVAFCVAGNHDAKLARKLKGRDVTVRHGMEESLEQLAQESDSFVKKASSFLDGLVSHYVLDAGKLVVAHAGLKELMHGRASSKVRDFALYGETTGEKDEYGLPVRLKWAKDYRGQAMVVYGHTPVAEPEWLNGTVNIDTGCVFGGALTALRYPEQETVSVPAQQMYVESIRPFKNENPISDDEENEHRDVQQQSDDQLYLEDVIGKRRIATWNRDVTIEVGQSAVALETMSRFAIDPKWLIYLPPTMSPSDTSQLEGWLEHPQEAFSYYEQHGVKEVVCEEKHMGSRAIVIVCRNEMTAKVRFGITDGKMGVCYTRTGRSFFDDDQLESQFILRIQQAMGKAKLWERWQTDWVCLDSELMPWSAKAQELLRQQYAAVGAASQNALPQVIEMLEKAEERELPVHSLLEQYRRRWKNSERFVSAYRNYCWKVESLSDLKLAPFHLLATEGKVHIDQDHVWHMEELALLSQADPDFLLATRYRVVNLKDEESRADTVKWWEEMISHGGEGMVVKPKSFVVKGERGLIQPAVKCRGREYLRIIYGPDYTEEEHLERLRVRGLRKKRSLALREFSLGVEGLLRFGRREPLRRVHECVFGVMALESEPLDPRL
ncbi:polynucleotide kinase-phosphatase [Mechercharimyces sp. CAU 1602]|uniref:polynucleotide kinase-phosphatase n=1 Tax=Mechercharimyces sp. CAU 1602 TaxID=2973933 RepID=UPI0021639BE9|nr:polynucleotide kinase-phosphatase [Mechercharimyces sp. CAU 1602]MCS1350414.1 polynucleotide kinase-phosphatase [Mechercharimyces sp. CAU 1602]